MMTARKRVGPMPTHRLAMRHSVDYSSSNHFSLEDSSRDSSSSSSSESYLDSSVDALSDSASSRSSSDHSLPTPSSGSMGKSSTTNASLPPKWSKFVTDVKLVKDLHTTNFDQLHAYLEQHELYANEVRIMRECNQDPLALVANHQMTPSYFNAYHYPYNNPQFQQQFSPSQSPHYGSIQACPQPPSVPHIEYTVSIVNQQTHMAEFPQIDSGLAVPVFKQGDNPIDAINKMISFLSSHLGRQNSYAAGTSGTRANTSGPGGNYSGQQRVVKCFNCQGEGHMARHCTKTKRKRDATWFRDKVLLVKAQGNAYHADDLDAYDSDYDEISTAKAVLIANLSSYGSDVLSKLSNQVTNCNKVNNDNLIANDSLFAELERYKEREKEAKNIDNEIALEKKVKKLDNIVHKMGQSAQTVHMQTKPQVFYDNNLKQALGFQIPFYLKKAQQIRLMLYDGSVITKETNVIY
ncbi:retrovirus-related pol polyprotein from transposon TNT 1-94 [Tanacetum coccineum]